MTEGQIQILDVRIDAIRSAQAEQKIEGFIGGPGRTRPGIVFFANVHSLHLARGSRAFLTTLGCADLVLPDGSGLSIAGRLFGSPIPENLNGTDFSPRLLERAAEKGWTIYLFGGRRDVLERARKNLLNQFPRLRIVGTSPGFLDHDGEMALLEDIRRASPDILLVGLGSPRQEEWIVRHASRLNARVCLAVGGLFDFVGERFQRAPRWLRALGLEWLYRFLQDPRTKWDRVFIEIPGFLLTVLVRALGPRGIFRLNRES